MANTLTSKRALARTMIEQAKGQFASVKFTKKDGSTRVMTVQPAAGKFHVKGADASPSARQGAETRAVSHPNLMPVWDVANNAFRSINLDTIDEVRIGGNTVSFA